MTVGEVIEEVGNTYSGGLLLFFRLSLSKILTFDFSTKRFLKNFNCDKTLFQKFSLKRFLFKKQDIEIVGDFLI